MAEEVMDSLPWDIPGSIGRYNDAIMAHRLFSTDCSRDEFCAVCGESLHPYPSPTYWMQYPLPTCCLIDGKKIHDHSEEHGRHDCIHRYLANHPTPRAPVQQELFA